MKKFRRRKAYNNESRNGNHNISYNAKRDVNKISFSKEDLVDIGVEASPYTAFIAMYVMKDDWPLKLVQLETDRNSVQAAIDFAEPISRIDNLHVDRIHDRLAGILASANEATDDLDNIIINYIGCFQSEIALRRFPDQHVGYSLYFDVDTHDRCRLKGGTKSEIEDLFNIVVGTFSEEFMERHSNNRDE